MTAFCTVYGNTIRNRVLEYVLQSKEIDFGIGDMARNIGISRPKAYQVVEEFQKRGIFIKSRIIGRTQLYCLNRKSAMGELFLKDFLECQRIKGEGRK